MSLIRTLAGIAPPAGAPGEPVFPTNAYDMPGDGNNYIYIPGPGLRNELNGADRIGCSMFVVTDDMPLEQAHVWFRQYLDNTEYATRCGPMNVNGQYRMQGRAKVGDAHRTSTVSSVITYGEQNHWYMEWNFAGNKLDAWKDGVQISNQSAALTSPLTIEATNLGCGLGISLAHIGSAGHAHDGYIIWVGFFDVLSNTTDRNALAAGARPSTITGCVAEYTLNPDDAGGGLDDSSGNGAPSAIINGSLPGRRTPTPP